MGLLYLVCYSSDCIGHLHHLLVDVKFHKKIDHEKQQQQQKMTILFVISFIFLILFPLFEAAAYIHLHWKRNDILIRKRNKSAIYVASFAGWLAYFNLVVSMFGGVPCGIFYVASLLVAPISVGPQIVRALTLRGTIRHSKLVIEDEISNREQKKKGGGGQLPTIPSESDLVVAASEKKVEADRIMEKTRRIANASKWALAIIPTLAIILTLALTTDGSQLLTTDFSRCQPEPTPFLFTSPAFGVIFAILAFLVTCLSKKIDDELQIANEIRRNSILLGCTYIVIIVVRLTGYSEWQPLLQTIQQMLLSLSMAIVPFLPSDGGGTISLNSMATWAKRRINPATKSAVPAYGRPLPKERTFTRASIMGRQNLTPSNTQRDREMTVSWDAGLCILLSTTDGINLFSQHCAREFRYVIVFVLYAACSKLIKTYVLSSHLSVIFISCMT